MNNLDYIMSRLVIKTKIKKENIDTVAKKEIKKIADEKFGSLQGIAQQYLFYWKRESA